MTLLTHFVPGQVQMCACINLSLSLLEAMCCSPSRFHKQFHVQDHKHCRIMLPWSGPSSQGVKVRCNNKHTTTAPLGRCVSKKGQMLIILACCFAYKSHPNSKETNGKPPAGLTGLFIWSLVIGVHWPNLCLWHEAAPELSPNCSLCFGDGQTARERSNSWLLWF